MFPDRGSGGRRGTRGRSHAHASPAGAPPGSGGKGPPGTQPVLDRTPWLLGSFQDGFSELFRAGSGPQRRAVSQQVVREGAGRRYKRRVRTLLLARRWCQAKVQRGQHPQVQGCGQAALCPANACMCFPHRPAQPVHTHKRTHIQTGVNNTPG
jgi:hypothetical protein